jgi:uncharacterized membrane protein YeaQ/YmgE (transglycosylase-associated protein family)
MEIQIEFSKWGFGFYSDFIALDFTWGFLGSVVVIYFVNKILKRNDIKLFRKRVK